MLSLAEERRNENIRSILRENSEKGPTEVFVPSGIACGINASGPGATDPSAKPDISATLAERGGRYGQFIDHSKIAQGLQDILRDADNWAKLEPDMKQALTVICDKMARILNGDPWYEDNWHDIQGYSKLVEDRIRKLRGEV